MMSCIIISNSFTTKLAHANDKPNHANDKPNPAASKSTGQAFDHREEEAMKLLLLYNIILVHNNFPATTSVAPNVVSTGWLTDAIAFPADKGDNLRMANNTAEQNEGPFQTNASRAFYTHSTRL